jgi:hypothetical protein
MDEPKSIEGKDLGQILFYTPSLFGSVYPIYLENVY